jgi:glutaredoxin
MPTDDEPTTPAILILGRDTCSDTTRSRAHLTARGIAFTYRNHELEPEVDAWIRRLNDGWLTTPTILIGDPEAPTVILREPSDDELDAAIGEAAGA